MIIMDGATRTEGPTNYTISVTDSWASKSNVKCKFIQRIIVEKSLMRLMR